MDISVSPLPPNFLDEDEFRHFMAVWFLVRLDNPQTPPEVTRFDTGVSLSDCYFETCDMDEVADLFELFFKDDYESLYESLFSMEVAVFGEY